MTDITELNQNCHLSVLGGREFIRTIAIRQVEHYFVAVLNGRDADDVIAENRAELDSYATLLPVEERQLFEFMFNEEHEGLRRAVVDNAELQAIIACGVARNKATRRQKLIDRACWAAVFVASFVLLGLMGYSYVHS